MSKQSDTKGQAMKRQGMRTREQLLAEWDTIRATIASGCANSGPRDWFEGVLDESIALALENEKFMIEREREECATIADDQIMNDLNDQCDVVAAKIAAQIRARNDL